MSQLTGLLRDTSWTAWPLKIGSTGCLETSVINDQPTLRNIPEEQKSHLHRGEGRKSRILSTITHRRKKKMQLYLQWQ
jgi:hypothetical protein